MKGNYQRSAKGAVLVVSLLSSIMILYKARKRISFDLAQYFSTCTKGPPKLSKKPQYVGFGDIEGFNRGSDPMVPPVYLKDDYYYVRDDKRENKLVINHLHLENKYTNGQLKHLKESRENLYKELLSHVQETDDSYPYPYGAYEYYSRTVEGKSYTIYCRKQNKVEEVILDVNELAVGKKHCQVGCVSPSPDHSILAFSEDAKGYETYQGYFVNLKTKQTLEDRLENISSRVVWGYDNKTVYYATMDDAHRTNKIWRHTMGTSSTSDECLYEENDEVFGASFGKSDSGDYLIVGSSSSETSEFYYLDLKVPNATLTLVEKRTPGVEYSVDHHGNHFYIVTNKDKAINFKLMKTPIASPSAKNWVDVMPYGATRKTDYIKCFKTFFAIFGREEGTSQIWILPVKGEKGPNVDLMHRISFDESSYDVYASVNKEFNTTKLRFCYTSLTTPVNTFDYDVKTKKKKLLKERPCPNYDRSLYATEKLTVPSSDGQAQIPMSMIYRKDKVGTGPRPLHLYGYGSYEICIDPGFQTSILPLLDHGVTYVIAHIRGGGEMGRTWYEDAKYLTKKKTFEDFVSCAQHLVDTKITAPHLMTCEGRSAGGLLMGAVLNMRPDLFKASIAGVPFVDVMNSMCDSTIPLTTGEWEEWGNPNSRKYFDYMLSYSPYENVKPQAYPNMLVTSGLYDPRVAYW